MSGASSEGAEGLVKFKNSAVFECGSRVEIGDKFCPVSSLAGAIFQDERQRVAPTLLCWPMRRRFY